MKNVLTALCVAAVLAAAGCSSTPPVRLQPDGPIELGQGEVPLLRVNVSFEETAWIGRPGWGGLSQRNPAHSFARLVSGAAEQTAAMNVPPPREVEKQISAGDGEFSLNPDDEQLQRYLSILQPDTYLTADLRAWQENYYTGLFQDSTVRFTLTCHRSGQSEPLWTATVNREEDYVSSRELALSSLREVFEGIIARPKKEAPK